MRFLCKLGVSFVSCIARVQLQSFLGGMYVFMEETALLSLRQFSALKKRLGRLRCAAKGDDAVKIVFAKLPSAGKISQKEYVFFGASSFLLPTSTGK